MQVHSPIPTLSVKSCEERQQHLVRLMEEQQLDAVLIGDPRHVHYYAAYWERPFFAPLFLMTRDGVRTLVMPFECDWPTAVDIKKNYIFNKVATMVEEQLQNSLLELSTELHNVKRLGVDFGIRPGLLPVEGIEQVDLYPAILKQRRRKYDDEIELFKRLFQTTEAAYEYVRENLKVGVTEVELYAGMMQILGNLQGEHFGFFGNDFRCGEGGGLPRYRPAESGELAVIDLGVECRGYRSDMCRTIAVDSPSAAQEEAREQVLEAIQLVESSVRPGVSCREVYENAYNSLNDYRGWSFPHHLGHGLGLSPHEAPHLNPEWDDYFEVGDLFTVEPGLYHDELKGGLRIEEVYYLGESGLEKITTIPTGY
ncbi:putative peptidase [Polystyrenella longa]|uniref:Putative peptidase n=1 Tax=Polystyrenella longa TaxID=2528007 RepID=A0A518CPH7_9PLAN|nr:Xaa-Pro peptidase family protein [Polystyrenella longa]QDU81118.1 putative peptidase [Polystyrenella longa]